MKTHVTKPCGGDVVCPFRKDSLKGWLGKERIEEIISEGNFVCHKNPQKQCAGHMLLLKGSNSYYRLAKQLNINLGLTGEDLVFSSVVECINHHTKE